MDTLGWMGGVLLALCAIPEVISSIRSKRCNLSHGFLWMWYIGEWCILIPVVLQGMAGFLVFNYALNIALISVLMYYKYRRL
jgi:uncharacterized protein with PQ loop repeat